MKKEVNPGLIAAIVVVALLLIGGVGYAVFFSKPTGQASTSGDGLKKTQEMAAKQQEMMKQQQQNQSGQQGMYGGQGMYGRH